MLKSTMAAGALALFTLFSGTAPLMAADAGTVSPTVAVTATTTISPTEADALKYMREEEKLAHDVYVKLYETWGLQVFSNIAASEQKHTDAVAVLLTRYGISDPTAGKATGEFANADLQALYDQLVAQGALSIDAALKVGAAIEEIDILDLQEHTAETVKVDILRVYENLRSGSENHLRAFVSTLENQTGASYAPQYMDQTTYDALMSGTTGGRNGGRGASGRW